MDAEKILKCLAFAEDVEQRLAPEEDTLATNNDATVGQQHLAWHMLTVVS